MAGAPRVSVVMPVYNAESYLDRTVGALLAQTLADFELVAVDDGSTDGSLAKLRAFQDARVRVIARPHEGVVATMNAAVAAARGDLVARADADDICACDRLERQARYLDANPGVGVVGGFARAGRRTVKYPLDSARIRWTALYEMPFANPSVMFRRGAFHAVGGVPVDHRVVDDYPLLSRIIDHHEAANLPVVLVDRAAPPTSLTVRAGAAQQAEGDRVRRANILRLVPEPADADAVFHLLVGGSPPPALEPVHIRGWLHKLITGFRRRWRLGDAAWGSLAPWVSREIFSRALLHGSEPAVLLAMALFARRLSPALMIRPAFLKGLVRHLVLARLAR